MPVVVPHASDREAARYPTHYLFGVKPDEKATSVICNSPLMLPEQVPLRSAPALHLYCVGCRGLVGAAHDKVSLARSAAEAEGFTAVTLPESAMVPGMMPPVLRAGLFWAHRLPTMRRGALGYDDGEKALAHARPLMEAEGYMVEGVLNDHGRTMAALIADPPVDPALARTDDPALAPAVKPKRLSRAALVNSLIPRCANVSCYSPLPPDGACSCGKTETDPRRLAELARCWGIVNERAPEKLKRTKKAPAAKGDATRTQEA